MFSGLTACQSADPGWPTQWRCEGSGFDVGAGDVEALTYRSWAELVAPWTGVRVVQGEWRGGDSFFGLLSVTEAEDRRAASYDCDAGVALVHTGVDVALSFDDGSPPLVASGPLRWYHLRPEGPGLLDAQGSLRPGDAGWLWLSLRDGYVRGGLADGSGAAFEGSF